MHAICHETAPSTSVHDAIKCRLMDSSMPQLVTHSSTHLRVYRTNPYVLEKNDDDAWIQTTRLECMLATQVFAPIRSIVSARIPGGDRDMIFLAFDDAKLSALAYEPLSHELVTVSMHAFEEPLLRTGYTGKMQEPILASDPQSHCVAMLVYGRHLAILPLIADLHENDVDARNKTPSQTLLHGAKLHSYIVSLTDIDSRLWNIASMCFLHAYYEPTLLLLYEPVQTTVGRLAIRYDTYCMLAVSINPREQQHAVIWTVNQLPYDALRVQAVPRPVGGVLLTCNSSIIYLNQAVPSFGVSVSGGYRGHTAFPMHEQKELKLELSGSACDFLTSTSMLYILCDGRAVTMSLLIDDLSTVRGVRVEEYKELECVPPTALVTLDALIFVASWLTDSMLLAYAEHKVHPVQVTSDEPQQNVDKKNDDVDIYGEVVATQQVHTLALVQYHFEPVSCLPHLGPLKFATLASPSLLSEPMRDNKLDPSFDLIFAASDRRWSSLVTIQKSFRPNIITSSKLAGAKSIFACGQSSQTFEHRFVLAAKDSTTMVLEASDEIVELPNAPFTNDETTLLTVDMFDNDLTIQVCPMSVCAVRGIKRVQYLLLDIAFPLKYASPAQPYIGLLSENNQILILEVVRDADNVKLELTRLDHLTMTTRAAAICMYCDTSGIMVLSDEHTVGKEVAEAGHLLHQQENVMQTNGEEDSRQVDSLDADLDDEDALLYGTSTALPVYPREGSPERKKPRPTQHYPTTFDNFDRSALDEHKPVTMAETDQATQRAEILFAGGQSTNSCRLCDPSFVESTHWLFVAREHTGSIDIYLVPDMRLVFSMQHASLLSTLFVDTQKVNIDETTSAENLHAVNVGGGDAQSPRISEIACVGMGPNGCRPHLFMIVEEYLAIYEAFPLSNRLLNRLCVRWRKCKTATIYNRRTVQNNTTLVDLSAEVNECGRQFYPVDTIGKYYNKSLFIAGAYPHWAMMETNELKLHYMNLEAPRTVLSLCSFNNDQCPKGALYLLDDHTMRVATLDHRFEYDAYSPYNRAPIRPHIDKGQPSTVHYIAYLLSVHAIAVVSSQEAPHTKLFEMVGDEKSATIVTLEPEEYLPPPTIQHYTLSFHIMEDLSLLPGMGHVEFEEYETITSMKEVQLKDENTGTMNNYIAASSVWNYGEEVLIRGRLFVWEIVEVVPPDDQPLAKYKLKTHLARDEAAPVTAVASSNGYLFEAKGQKVYIWGWKDEELIGISFIDLSFYVHDLVGLHHYCLAIDIQRSLALLRYQEQFKALSIASRDYRPTHLQAMPLGCGFVVDNRQLSFLMTDEDGNLTMFVYAPDIRESRGGHQLVPRGEINIGQRIAKMIRVQSRVSDPIAAPDHEQRQLLMSRHINLYGTLDGALGAISPLNDKTARKLVMLQSIIINYVTLTAGLNPRHARHPKGIRDQKVGVPLVNGGNVVPRNLIDGDLVFAYFFLPLNQRHEVAKRLGTTRRQLHDDLLQIYRAINHV